MIEKLLELFLHAKAGAISGVLLIGASGALVTATTQNGVTTITVTQASPTPSASASPSPTPSASASPSPSVSPSPRPSPSPSAAPSLAAASPTTSQTATRACVEATHTVNAAFHKHHGALAKLRSGDDHGRSAQTAAAQTASKDATLTVKKADDLLKTIRKAAVKAIHETCKSHDDEDRDEDEDEDEEDEDKAPKSGLVLTGTPAEIAKQATAAMDLVMAAVRSTAQPTTTVKSGHEKDRDEQKSKDKGKSKKGGRD